MIQVKGSGKSKGGHATFGLYPRVCTGCGKPVRITGFEPLWFHFENGVYQSWHMRCR